MSYSGFVVNGRRKGRRGSVRQGVKKRSARRNSLAVTSDPLKSTGGGYWDYGTAGGGQAYGTRRNLFGLSKREKMMASVRKKRALSDLTKAVAKYMDGEDGAEERIARLADVARKAGATEQELGAAIDSRPTRNAKGRKKMAKKRSKKKSSKKRNLGPRKGQKKQGRLGAKRIAGIGRVTAGQGGRLGKKKAKKKAKKRAKKKTSKKRAKTKTRVVYRCPPGKKKKAKKKARKKTSKAKLRARKAKRTKAQVKRAACVIGRKGRLAQGKKPGRCATRPKFTKPKKAGAVLAKRKARALGHTVRNHQGVSFSDLSQPW